METLAENTFKKLLELAYALTGINVSSEKKGLIEHKLRKVLRECQLSSFEELYEKMIADGDKYLVQTFIDRVSTNFTYFFREPDHYEALSRDILPSLTKSLLQDNDYLRIWSAGCSSGEEPYTIAMVIHDTITNHKTHLTYKILATDISERMLKKAIKGEYPYDSLKNVSKYWKEKYFKKTKDGYLHINHVVKDNIVFRKLNLKNKHFPFKRKFHIIFCRNVLIYFDRPTRINILHNLQKHLQIGGYLFLGHSEFDSYLYNYFTKAGRSIYKKHREEKYE